jgi:hypothetical protein
MILFPDSLFCFQGRQGAPNQLNNLLKAPVKITSYNKHLGSFPPSRGRLALPSLLGCKEPTPLSNQLIGWGEIAKDRDR